MAQEGQSISGNAIKWRETNVNVPFSPLGGNFEMFLEYFRPHRHSITAIHAGRDEGARGRKDKHVHGPPPISPLSLCKIILFPPYNCMERK